MKLPGSLRKQLSRRRVYIQLLAILITFFKRALKMVKIKKLNINMDYGDNDCARLGIMKGIIEGTRGYIKAKHKNVHIRFTPHFNKKKLDLQAELEINLTGARIIKQMTTILIYSLKKKEVRRFILEFILHKFGLGSKKRKEKRKRYGKKQN
jgi:hypothetical protein